MPLEAINDFVIRFANVNGSGSASANEMFARAIMRMGVPVAPRNVFPSNIQGLPTWYEIRVNEKGHLGARGGTDFMIAMNPQTFNADVASIEPDGYLLYDNTRALPPGKMRTDINVIGVPLTAICNKEYTDPRQRQLFKNIICLGVLIELFGMDFAEVEKLISEQYRGKDKLIRRTFTPCTWARTGRAPTSSRSACASAAPPGSAIASCSKGITRRRSAPSMAAPRCARGIRSRRHRRWRKPSPITARNSATIPKPARRVTPSCRPRTSSPRSAWWSAPAGTAPVRSPQRPAPASP